MKNISHDFKYLFSSSHIYRLPNIYIQHQNGTWLDAPLQLNSQLYQILISVQLQRLLTRVYRLSKAYSYFFSNSLTISERDYLQRLILATYNQQSNPNFTRQFSSSHFLLIKRYNRW